MTQQQIINKLKQNNIIYGKKNDKIVVYFIDNYSKQNQLKYYELLIESTKTHYVIKMKYRKYGRILNHYSYVLKQNKINNLIQYILELKDHTFYEREIIDDEMKIYMINLYKKLQELGYNVEINEYYQIKIIKNKQIVKLKIERHDLQSSKYMLILRVVYNDQIIDYLSTKKINILDWLKKFIPL